MNKGDTASERPARRERCMTTSMGLEPLRTDHTVRIGDSQRRRKKQPAADRRGLFPHHLALRVLIDATGELRIHTLAVRHRERGVRPVGAALIVRARRKDLVLRAAVLAHETAEIAETISAAELPECLLTAEQRGRRILRR